MERVIKTRVREGAPVVETKLTVDFGTFTEKALQELAFRSLAIEAQSEWRKDEAIPTEFTITSQTHGPDAPREKRGPVDPKVALQKYLATLTPEERKAWIAEQMAG